MGKSGFYVCFRPPVTNIFYSESGIAQGPSSSASTAGEQLSLQQITKLAAALASSVGFPAVTIVPLDTPSKAVASFTTTTTETQVVTVVPLEVSSNSVISTTTTTTDVSTIIVKEDRTSLLTTTHGVTITDATGSVKAATVTSIPERTSIEPLSTETSVPLDTTANTATADTAATRSLHATLIGPSITSTVTNLKSSATTATALVGNAKTFGTNLDLSTRSASFPDAWEHISTTVIPLVTMDSRPTRSISSPQSTAVPSTTAIHFVDVGAQGQSLFNPIQVDAAVGDIVVFRFLKSNHTVTQSTFDNPCNPMGGFDSGFQYYNPLNQTGVINQVLPFLVRDSEPTWFYCRQSTPQLHCSAGMVFGINTGDNINAFVAKAKASSLSARDSRTGGQYWNTTKESGSFSTGSGIPGPTTTTLKPVSTGGAVSKGVKGEYMLSVASLFVALFLVPHEFL